MDPKPKTHLTPFKILIIALIEGATVMTCELLGAKMIAPFFGTTIHVWAAVLAITLGGLATGYYVGGFLSRKYPISKLLFVILLASGLLTLAMPHIGSIVMKSVINMSLISGLLISLMVFLFPVIVLFGMVGPVLIQGALSKVEEGGKTAGKIYAISTLGGVVNTLIVGFYWLPNHGIKLTALIYGVLILALVLLVIGKTAKKVAIPTVILFLSLGIYGVAAKKEVPEGPFTVLHESEGLMGQIRVVDFFMNFPQTGPVPARGLIVNNTWQTILSLNDQISMLTYIAYINPLIRKYGPNDRGLLIGLGGGMLSRTFVEQGIQSDFVEIDARLERINRDYFGLPSHKEVIIDDGRHFLETTKKKYDLIILDAFQGENPPWHLLTLEAFERVHKLLTNKGLMVIEFYGLTGENKAARAIYKTLLELNWHVKALQVGTGEGDLNNTLFLASKSTIDLNHLMYDNNPYTVKPVTDLNAFVFNPASIKISDVNVLVDDKPELENLLMRQTLQWRKYANENLRNSFIQADLPLFK